MPLLLRVQKIDGLNEDMIWTGEASLWKGKWIMKFGDFDPEANDFCTVEFEGQWKEGGMKYFIAARQDQQGGRARVEMHQHLSAKNKLERSLCHNFYNPVKRSMR
ncbi:hypothetical protein ACTXT7_016368 [Hymenolepis weldensis]